MPLLLLFLVDFVDFVDPLDGVVAVDRVDPVVAVDLVDGVDTVEAVDRGDSVEVEDLTQSRPWRNSEIIRSRFRYPPHAPLSGPEALATMLRFVRARARSAQGSHARQAKPSPSQTWAAGAHE